MSELRQDPTTKDWVILAPERSRRPKRGPEKKHAGELPPWDKGCPFCPGNEDKTPDEVFRLPVAAPGKDWRVRVVPNRFAALSPEGDITRVEEGRFFHKMNGYGLHEVIIESPVHNEMMAFMSYEHVEQVVISYQERYNALKRERGIQFVHIFKNHGWAAGTSLEHPHSQVVATPIIAPYYKRKFEVAMDYYSDMGRCLMCDLISWDMESAKDRVVAVTDEFLVVHPYASRVPFETWIIPREHSASFGRYPGAKLAELSMVLKDSLFTLGQGLGNPAFNMMIDSTTTEDEHDPFYHWHIRIMPRLSEIAGFEIGSGIYISTAFPEETAAEMRSVVLNCDEEHCVAFRKALAGS